MNKNLLVSVLVVLLIASIGWGIFLNKEKAKLANEKIALQSKIDKGLAYAKALNLLLEPGRIQAGLPTTQNFSSELDWLSAFSSATDATADSTLQGNLEDIKKGGNAASKATMFFMNHTASATVDALK